MTKDKKKIRDATIQVYLAWKSTLFVTNFPEEADDAWIRELFGKVRFKVGVRDQRLTSETVRNHTGDSMAQQEIQELTSIRLRAIYFAGELPK